VLICVSDFQGPILVLLSRRAMSNIGSIAQRQEEGGAMIEGKQNAKLLSVVLIFPTYIIS
jgi:hypothetical protein